ncbi:MAG: uracil-DNA glycosylase family protein [Thiogranum sp.]
MGIQGWTARYADSTADVEQEAVVFDSPEPVTDVALEPPPDVFAETSDVAGLDWPALEARVSDCRLCDLHASRTRTVFGVGNRSADWLVIGEAPGHDEDQQGEPFVGRAGQLLNAMLQAVGLRRGQVYIANILKCRPPNNRDPKPEEVVCCEPYLLRQIELIQPRLILAVGRIAAQNLLNTQTPIGKLRGEVHRFRDTGIPLIATYHPAYLLRSPLEKRKSWQDLQLALRTVQEEGG